MSLREQPGVPPTFPTWTRNPDEQGARRQHQQRVPSQDDEEEDSNDVLYTTRLPSSARRYQYRTDDQPSQEIAPERSRKIVRYHYQDIPPRRSRIPDDPPSPPPRQSVQQPDRARSRKHWLLYVGIGMTTMTLLWYLLSAAANWWQITQDDWHYGRPCTYQTDARVGHDDAITPSHFMAMNLNRHVMVIELPGGDPSKAKIYAGPTLFGDGQDLTPVTLEFKDVNGDGKLDMLMHIQGQTMVFINENGAFRPLKPGEHVTL